MSIKEKIKKFKYKHVKVVILLIGITFMVIGPIIAASSTSLMGDLELTSFTVSESDCYRYGHFNTTRVTIRGVIVQSRTHKPAAGTIRPAVFCFHGMFGSWHDMLGIAAILARMGFVVICPSAPGSGDSTGQYNLGLELQGMGLTLIDWLWEKGNSTYGLQVNASQVGATGHSYGGITTTFIGINSPNISAAVSFWTWKTSLEAITNIIGLPADINVLSSSNLWRIMQISGWGHAVNPPYNTLEVNLALRDAATRVNFSQQNIDWNKPKNWLLITGSKDEVTVTQQQMEIMANASMNSTTTYNTILNEITTSVAATQIWSNEHHANANFTNGTMRKIFIPTGYNHGDIVNSLITIKEMVNWFGSAWGWNVAPGLAELAIYEMPVFGKPYTQTYSFLTVDGLGSGLFLAGLVMALLPIASLILKRRKTEEEYVELQETIPDNLARMEKKEVLRSLSMYAGIYLGVSIIPGLLILTLPALNAVTIGIPYLIADVYSVISLVFTWLLIPMVIVLFHYERKKYSITLDDVGLSKERMKENILQGLAIPITIIAIFNIGNMIMVNPLMIPKDSPSLYYNGLLLLFVYLLVISITQEMIFRGLAQSKIEAQILQWKTENRLFKHDFVKRNFASLVSGAYSVAVNAGASLIIIRILLGLENTRFYQLSGDYLGIVILAVLLMTILPSIINPYLYQRSKSLVPGILMIIVLYGVALTSGALAAGVTFF